MNETQFSPDDPKLTAYALGELEDPERAAVEVALRDDPAARAVVDEIRAFTAQLASALATEPAPAAPAEPAVAKAAIVAGPKRSKLGGGPLQDPRAALKRGKLLRFPQLYFVLGGLAAACFALVIAWQGTSGEPSGLHTSRKALPSEEAKPSSVSASVESEQAARAEKREIEREAEVRQMRSQTTRAKESAAVAQHENAASVPVAPAAAVPPSPPPISATPAQPQNAMAESATVDSKQSGVLASSEVGSLATTSAQPVISVPKFVLPSREQMVKDALAMQAPRNLPPAPTRFELHDEVTFGASTGGGSTLAATRVQSEGTTFYHNPIPNSQMIGGKVQADSVVNGRKALSLDAEAYAYRPENDFVSTADNPVSTFSADVDTASYANVRRFIQNGLRPPVDAVRIEELLNYFSYHYSAPESHAPFSTALEVADAPWAPGHRLVRIGLKAREVSAAERGPANLVFLLDVSGSMADANKLPLVKDAMHRLLQRLRPDDHVAIVTYAGETGLALAATPVAKVDEIEAALDRLVADGSTNGGMGIQLAYDIAKANFAKDGVNRVILCTDGDFNVGVTSEGDLLRLIKDKARSGVFLTVLGFGMGNYKDAMLQKLADAGNGNYGYIDSPAEAQKLLVEGLSATLVTVAKDVKLQVEFNPAKVEKYRLIGYEKRKLAREDFNNDRVDAGEMGAGHAVTALYEIVPAGAADATGEENPPAEPLRYGPPPGGWTTDSGKTAPASDELLMLKIRYKEPTGERSHKLEFPLVDHGGKFSAASADFKFAAAVASFGQILRESAYKGSATLADVRTWAEAGISDDPGGHRAEFVELVKQAEALK